MTKRMTLMLIAVAVIFGGIFGFKAFVNTQMQAYFDNAPVPPATVSAARAEMAEWSTRLHGVGTVVADQSIAVSAEVSGRVTRIGFRSGDVVQAGAVLVELDPSLDSAELQNLETQYELARKDYERVAALFAQKRVSGAERDSAQSQRDALAAQVAARRATLKKKTIVAPFSGRLGIRQINLGQVVQPGDAIVRLASLEPLHVDFTLPAQQLAELKEGLPVQIVVDAFGSEPLSARLTAMESVVDSGTRNIGLRATLDTAPTSLRAGSFADVAIVLPEKRRQVVIPQTAVSFQPYGNTVYVIAAPAAEGEMPTAQQRFVTTAETRGDYVAVTAGLQAGEEIVTSGQLKVRNGSKLVIDNDNIPAAALAPAPKNS